MEAKKAAGYYTEGEVKSARLEAVKGENSMIDSTFEFEPDFVGFILSPEAIRARAA